MTNLNIIDTETLVTRKNIISISVNIANTILKTTFIDYGGMTYFVLKNVFKQASIFALISLRGTGNGSHGSNTYSYSAPTCVIENNYSIIFLFSLLIIFCLCELHAM
jgi:hypothetical protein